ncbi:retrovirus-related pol polyprotein from transposon TNT 1-94 [Tanacetum coccineum]
MQGIGMDIANQNGNGNFVAARAEGNGNGNNENHISRDPTKEFDLMVTADCEEIKEVNANCILMANLQQASALGTHVDKSLVYDSDGSAELHQYENCYNNEIFSMFTVDPSRGEVEKLPATIEEICAFYEPLYNNLVIKLEKVKKANRKTKEANVKLTAELAIYKGPEKSFEFNQAKFDELENSYRKSVYQEQCLTKKINALHLSSSKTITTLNEKIANLNNQLSKQKSTVFYLQEERDDLKSDFKTREMSFLINSDHEKRSIFQIIPKRPVFLKQFPNHLILDDEFSNDTPSQSVARKFLNEVKDTIVTLQHVVKSKISLNANNWSSPAHLEIQKIFKDEIASIINQVDVRVINFEKEFLKEAAKFVRDFKSLAKEADESLDKIKVLEKENERLESSLLLTLKNLQANGFQVILLFLAGYRYLLMVRRLGLFQAYDQDSKAAHQLRMEDYGNYLEVAFRRNTCFVKNLNGVDLLKGSRSTNLYTINLHEMTSASPIFLMALATSTKSWLWHQRLSHINFDTITDLEKDNLVISLPKFKYTKDHLCLSCEQGKTKKSPHKPKLVSNSKNRLHLLHMDLCGSMRVKSINRKRYVLVIADDYSFPLQAPVIIVRIDNRTEFINQVLKAFFEDVNISHQTSSVRTPQQNKNDHEDIGKLGAKGDIGFFIGYSTTSCTYKVYNRTKKKVMETINVTFDELLAMAFEQRSLKPELQRMTSRHISPGLDVTYAPSTITSQKLIERELELLFETMYDDYIGSQPSVATRTAPAAPSTQNHHTLNASTTTAKSALIATNSSTAAPAILNTSQDVDELQQQ